MNKNKGRMLSLLSILLGSLAFISINLSYASSAIYGFSNWIRAFFIIIPILLLIFFTIAVIMSMRRNEKRTSGIKITSVQILVSAAFGWVLLTGAIYFLRYDILYTNSPVRQLSFTQTHQQDNFEDISIKAKDNTILQGYLYNTHAAGKLPLAIYFGGRGEEATNISEYAAKVKGYCLAFINYRGCGYSEGRQDEENLLSDALDVYDYFADRSDIDRDNISVIAHSLGTGIAIHLSSERNIKRIALSAPYDKYTSGVIQDKFPLIPVSLLISDEFNSLAIAPKLNIPAIFLLAENDRTIFRSRSLALFNSWGGSAEKVIIKGTHHENITLNDAAWDNINRFLNSGI